MATTKADSAKRPSPEAVASAAITARVEQQARSAANINAQLIAQLWRLWSGFTAQDWWNPDMVNGAAAASVQLVTVALRQNRLAQRSFTKSTLRSLKALPSSLPAIQNDYPRSGVDPIEVYTRPAKQYQYAFSQGKTFEESRDVAKTRVEDLAQMDLLKTQMDESRTIYQAAPKVIGMRRIIHPEKSKTGTCGLCIVAATRFYKKSELMPLHGGCNCTTLPITSAGDPGLNLNQSDLNDIYEAAGSTAAADLKRTRVTIHENGELGPILTAKGDQFRGPSAAGASRFNSKPLTDADRFELFTQRISDLQPKIAQAQADYAEQIANGQAPQDIVGVFRAIKQLTDYEKSLQTQLKALAPRQAA